MGSTADSGASSDRASDAIMVMRLSQFLSSKEGSPMSSLLRRDFLTRAAAFAAATTATLTGTRRAGADDKPPQPIRGKEGTPIIGPTNPAREAQNVDRFVPPSTDHGTM